MHYVLDRTKNWDAGGSCYVLDCTKNWDAGGILPHLGRQHNHTGCGWCRAALLTLLLLFFRCFPWGGGGSSNSNYRLGYIFQYNMNASCLLNCGVYALCDMIDVRVFIWRSNWATPIKGLAVHCRPSPQSHPTQHNKKSRST